MKTSQSHSKSKLYCTHCGSFNLTHSRFSSLKKRLLQQPIKLVCQSCSSTISHTEMLANEPKHLPKIYCVSDQAVMMSSDNIGRTMYISMSDLISNTSQPSFS